MSIEDAAVVFQNEIDGGSAPKGSGIRDMANAPEPIFDNSAVHENDQIAGGDDEPDPEPRPARSKKPKAEAEDEELQALLDQGLSEEEARAMLGREPVDPDEDDDEDDPDEDEDDEDEDDEDSELMEKIFTVKVDGEEIEAPLKEILQGYTRTKTFMQRMNQIDHVKQELSGHIDKIAADRKRVDEILAEAEEIVKGILPPEPDWDKLFAEDPKGARELQKQYDGFKAKVDEIRARREKLTAEQAEKEKRELAEFAKAEFPKFVAIAKWRDRKDMEKDLDSMRRTAMRAGFSEEEIAQVLDSRMLHILLKASKYDRMMAARPKAVKRGKTPVNPGAGSGNGRTAQRGITGAQKRLARTGSIDDAAAAFQQVINPKKSRR